MIIPDKIYTYLTIFLIFITYHTTGALAQSGADTVLPLWPDGLPNAVSDTLTDLDKPEISVFLPDNKEAVKTGVVIFPGGGYAHLAIDKEGNKVAEWFNNMGIAAFVVRYRLGMRYHHPSQVMDAQKAILTVRKKADSWGLTLQNVGVMGFSAGGHLASTAGTHFRQSYVEGTSPDLLRPDFMILIYPVVTMQDDYTHQGSRRHLLGENPGPGHISLLSNELQVNSTTPPAFLIHGSDDKAVPVENSLQFYKALLDYNIPVEMHLFEHGPHGFGMALDHPVLSQWTELCAEWLESRGY